MSVTASDPKSAASEKESLQVAEHAREQQWKHASFMKELFLGRFPFDLIEEFPRRPERPEFIAFYERMKKFLQEKVDPVAIDESGEYPPHVVEELKAMGAFGMKVPTEYGGLG